jgi:hypothetical protein
MVSPLFSSLSGLNSLMTGGAMIHLNLLGLGIEFPLFELQVLQL